MLAQKELQTTVQLVWTSPKYIVNNNSKYCFRYLPRFLSRTVYKLSAYHRLRNIDLDYTYNTPRDIVCASLMFAFITKKPYIIYN